MKFDSIPEVAAAMRGGEIVVVLDDEDRENEGDFIMAAEAVTPEKIAFIVRHSSGIICQPMTADRLAALELPQMVANNSESHRTAFTVSVDVRRGTTTGISAHDRALTIRALASADARPADFARPGHIFPLRYSDGGVLVRAGHTEATIDLARIAGVASLSGILVEIVNDDGSMKRGEQLVAFAREHGMRVGTIADLIRHRLRTERTVSRVLTRRVDTEFGPFELIGYRDAFSPLPHFALVCGSLDGDEPVLTRVHVRDTLSDVLHLRSGSGVTLTGALRRIAQAGRGVVVVLSDPAETAGALGRLEDTSDSANYDGREHGLGAQILADLGATRLRVLGTRRRFHGLAGFGLEIAGYEEAAEECLQ